MLINELVLRSICAELGSALPSSRVEKVYQPLEDLLLIELYPSPEKKKLAISINRTYGCLTLVERRPKNPQRPPAFCCLLRKHLKGSRLKELKGSESDRIAYLKFSKARGDTREDFTLELRLWAHKPNLLLFDSSGGALGKMKDYSKHRGKATEDPDFHSRSDSLPAFDEIPEPEEVQYLLESGARKELKAKLPGIPPPVLRLIREQCPSRQKEAIHWLLSVLEGDAQKKPVELYWPLTGKRMLLPYEPPLSRESNLRISPIDSLIEKVAIDYYQRGLDSRREKLKLDLKKALERHRKKLSRSLCKVRDGLRASDRIEDTLHRGELLKSVFHRIQPRSKKVSVYDWSKERNVEIALSPKLSAEENLERIFAKAKKQKRSLPILRDQEENLREELALLQGLEARLDSAESEAEVGKIREELIYLGAVQARQAKEKKGSRNKKDRGFRSYVSSDGLKIYVGRNGEENEALRSRIAKKHDLWFHVKEASGAHVVVKLSRGHTCPKSTLREAAQLASHFSKRRYDTRVEVCKTYASKIKAN